MRVRQASYRLWTSTDSGYRADAKARGTIVGHPLVTTGAGGVVYFWWVEWDDGYGDGWYPEDVLIEMKE